MPRLILPILCLFLTILARATSPTPAQLTQMDAYALLQWASYYSWKSLDSAFLFNDLALQKSRSAHDRVAEFYCFRDRGIYFEKYNRPAEAFEEYKKALATLDTLRDREKHLPIIWNDLAIASRKCGAYSECQNFHKLALELAQKNNDLELEEDSYHGLGFLYETVGEWEKAMNWYQKSVEVADRRGSKEGSVISFQNIANVLQKSENEQLALERIEMAWQIAQQCDSARRAHVLHDFGEILIAGGKPGEAISKFETSLTYYKKLGDRPMIARSLMGLAGAFAKIGDETKAIEFFNKALLDKAAIRPEDLVELWHDLGSLYLKKGDLRSAKTAFHESLGLAELYNFRDFLQKDHYSLSQILENEGDTGASHRHLKLAIALADSLHDMETNRRIVESEFRFETARTEKTIALLKAQTTKVTFGGVAVAALLFGAFMFFLYRQKLEHTRSLNRKNEEIEQRNQRLRESNEVLKQFAYATAHDLKEPLRTIGSFVGLLQKRHAQNLAPEANQYFEFVKAGAFRMNTMLSDLLEYSTVFMDSPEKGRTDISQGLREVMSNLQETIRHRGAVVELPMEISRRPVQIKSSHFVQLFQNLVANAIKFSPENPQVAVSVMVEKGGSYLFSVQDNGIGIDKNYQNKIFQIFQRLERERFEGAGIGLSICKSIVEKYGGSIWFESEPGHGANFFVRLPVAVEVEAGEMAMVEN